MERQKLRKPAVAGQFYPQSPRELKKQIAALVNERQAKVDAIGCILPHAGYMYSGVVAGKTTSTITVKDKIILLGPNHTGYGEPFSIISEGAWETPLGEVTIDITLTQALLKHSQYLRVDESAHLYEHSLEVELPFLQYFNPDFKLVPIVIGSTALAALRDVGKEIASTIQELGYQEEVLIVASSDMTHYEPQAQAQDKDREAINAVLELDEGKLNQKVKGLDISMCGYAPVTVLICAAKQLGATQATLVEYRTSGDVTGDYDSVVGYAGMVMT